MKKQRPTTSPRPTGARSADSTTDSVPSASGNSDGLSRAVADAHRTIAEAAATREALEAQFAERSAIERQIIRKQLHDGLGQLLTSMCFLVSSIRSKLATNGLVNPPELDELATVLNKAIAESHAIAAKCEAPSAPTRSLL